MQHVTVSIHTDFIKLQQVLKLAGFIDQGADVKFFLADGLVYVNGNVATERGKKIHVGDVVEVLDLGIISVVAEEN